MRRKKSVRARMCERERERERLMHIEGI